MGILGGQAKECQKTLHFLQFTWKEIRTHGEARHPVKTGSLEKGGPDEGRDLFELLATDLQFSPAGQSGQLPARRETGKDNNQVPHLSIPT